MRPSMSAAREGLIGFSGAFTSMHNVLLARIINVYARVSQIHSTPFVECYLKCFFFFFFFFFLFFFFKFFDRHWLSTCPMIPISEAQTTPHSPHPPQPSTAHPSCPVFQVSNTFPTPPPKHYPIPTDILQQPLTIYPAADTIRILVSTDNHVGYAERDAIRGDDSWKSFHEVMCLAKEKDVDMVLLAGDLFHENKPSRKAMFNVMRSLRMNCYGEKPCELEMLSDSSEVFEGYSYF